MTPHAIHVRHAVQIRSKRFRRIPWLCPGKRGRRDDFRPYPPRITSRPVVPRRPRPPRSLRRRHILTRRRSGEHIRFTECRSIPPPPFKSLKCMRRPQDMSPNVNLSPVPTSRCHSSQAARRHHARRTALRTESCCSSIAHAPCSCSRRRGVCQRGTLREVCR